MLTTERLTDSDDAPVYAVRDHNGAHLAHIRHRYAMWTLEVPHEEVIASDTDLDRLIGRLPRLLNLARLISEHARSFDALKEYGD